MVDTNSKIIELKVENLDLSFSGVKASHLKTPDPVGLMDELRKSGYEVHERAR